ncbi:hypothetical protein Amir_6628 [Actinosynnema mirum DSM 43827]|uniref:Mce-associated membrane protein n=1 Tax=Actinosynnema mirum (strain ATCC 29888 / DSM 43827 / JCM 3225 / NBRC 14064 / NCIMB 13271 / NRRL B-12336 / IMRU 3971 / 101) TaxID=446462 RepID=C6WN61_ACTMD|nr:hypothetical protein Amir_6628 [Actinosynnema mirum DSM 43827]
MPPQRRRPVPSPPRTRPRVAGLRRPGPPAPSEPPPTPTTEHPTPPEGTTTPPDAATTPSAASPTAPTARDERPEATAPEDAQEAAPEAVAPVAPASVTAPAPSPASPPAEPASERPVEPPADASRDDHAPELIKNGVEPLRPGSVAPSPTGGDASIADGGEPPSPPRPRAKRKRGHQVLSTDPTPEPSTPPRRPWLLPAALVLLSALLLALGAWFQTAASRVAYDRALVDAAGTAEVGGQVRDAVERAFSYDFADVGATERAAGEVLAGRAKCQYDAIFGQVRALAPEQKLVVTVKAVTSGVTSLDGDRATVLLFLDQVTTRTTDNRSGGGVAMMRVGARKEGGRWLVDGMDLFGQDATQAAELARCANAG